MRAEVEFVCGVSACASPGLGTYSVTIEDDMVTRVEAVKLPKGMAYVTAWIPGQTKPPAPYFAVESRGGKPPIVKRSNPGTIIAFGSPVKYRWKCRKGHDHVRLAKDLAAEIGRQGSRVFLT